ncbi:protein pollenless 3 [Quercus suber]|uniref:Protein pollenless 3 n=1 Tax=Quercus suber TaxID=58331 RepID=A0AAW0JYC8_QUESU
MWNNNNKIFPARGFSTPPLARKPRPAMPMSERKRSSPANESDPFHVIHKVPAGDSPYVRAKHVQLIDKDPSKAISLFWSAINAGDRVDSALKDMAIVMKQLDRSDEAIEAIKSFRHLCPYDSQESLDNVLVELYKRSGRVEEEIEMLQLKLKHIEEGTAFGGRRAKTARSQGKKVQITVEQEISRILGNLAWAYLQQKNYSSAEEHYRPMDESYAKSYERALQMLTELAPQVQVSFTLPVNRNSKEVNSFAGGGQYSGSAFMGCRMKENWVGSAGTEATPVSKSTYSSPTPTPTRKNLNVPFTQPKRCSWGFSNGQQRREIWGENSVRSASRKLSFEPYTTTENVQAQPIQDVNGDLLASPTPVNGDWRRSCRDLAKLKDESVINFTSQPRIMSVDQRRFDSYARIKDETATEYDSQRVVNPSWRRDFCEDRETKKFAMRDSNLSLQVAVEPPMVVDPVRTLEPSIYGEKDQSSGTSVSGCEKTLTTCGEECFRKSSPGISDDLHQPTTENPKSDHDNCKKSWADMVEEEEQELLSGINLMEYNDGWNSEDEFNDENLDSNLIGQSPYPQSQIKSLSCKFESFDLKDESSGVSVSSRNLAARRSLCFDQQQKPESKDYFCSSPLPKKALNFEGCISVQENGRDSISRGNKKMIRRNRLQVFQDITPLPESP